MFKHKKNWLKVVQMYKINLQFNRSFKQNSTACELIGPDCFHRKAFEKTLANKSEGNRKREVLVFDF